MSFFRKFFAYPYLREMVKNPKDLKDYTDEELYDFLENNEDMEAPVLAVMCSEILRRMIKEKNKLA